MSVTSLHQHNTRPSAAQQRALHQRDAPIVSIISTGPSIVISTEVEYAMQKPSTT